MKRMLNQNLIDFLNSLGDSLKYESSTNTFEIGTNLYVDGKLEVNDDTIFNGNLFSYNDSELTFYEGNNTHSSYMSISPLFGNTKLSFNYNDGQDIITIIGLDVSVDANILTDKNTKTLFGNKSLYGSGNIDLYMHNLSLTINGTSYYAVIYSSNNLVIDSVQDLTTVTKGHGQLLAIGSNKSVAIIAYQGSVWFNVLGEEGQDNNVTNVTDSVYTI